MSVKINIEMYFSWPCYPAVAGSHISLESLESLHMTVVDLYSQCVIPLWLQLIDRENVFFQTYLVAQM